MHNYNIPDALADLVRPIGTLTPWEGNYRRGNVEEIMKSLKRFGQVRPVLVQASTSRIVAGNHTHRAAQLLEWEGIAAVVVDMPDEEAEAYLIADNRASDLAENDDQSLLAALEHVAQSSMGLEGTGFTPDDVDDILAALDRIEETEVEEFSGDYAESPEVTAARWEDRDEGQRREVVFLLPHDDFEKFKEAVQTLKKRYETDSMSDAVFQAVMHEASQTSILD